jgi:TetR/AcrR family transcriptional regulator, cholesterol catabolism regulator
MAPAPAKTANGSRTNDSKRREEILQAAASVFARKGISNATVRDIADEVGILSGSLYHHFESKDQMVEEILLAGADRQGARYREIVKAEPDAVEAMRKLVMLGVLGVAEGPNEATILRNDAQQIKANPRLRLIEKQRQDTKRLWISVVRKGVEQGAFRDDLDADVAVRAMFDAVLSTIRWFPPLGRSSPQRIGSQLAGFFIDGLRGDDAGSKPGRRGAGR